jgi:uncharacterized protein (TIGR02118 family)
MVKFMILFHKPINVTRFGESYNRFLALIERIPEITRRQVISILGSPQGTPKTYRILEVYFDDYDALTAALKSPEGQAAGGALNQFPKGTFELLFAEVFEEVGGSTPPME